MDFFKNFLHSVLPKRETREPFCLLVLSLSKNPPPSIRPKPPFPRRLLRADIGERKGFCFPQAGDSSTQICSGDRVSLSLSRHGQTGRFRELRALHAPRQDTRAGEGVYRDRGPQTRGSTSLHACMERGRPRETKCRFWEDSEVFILYAGGRKRERERECPSSFLPQKRGKQNFDVRLFFSRKIAGLSEPFPCGHRPPHFFLKPQLSLPVVRTMMDTPKVYVQLRKTPDKQRRLFPNMMVFVFVQETPERTSADDKRRIFQAS